MNCEFCNHPFNLANKLPKILPCCGFTACQDCIFNLAGQPQQLVFTCPVKECGKQNQDQNSLNTNKHLEKILKQAIGIMCDQHPQNNCEFFCVKDQMFVCAGCIVGKHQGHQCLQTDKQEIINYNNKILEFLKRQYERIRVMINEMEAYQSNDKPMISQQYMKLIKEAQDIIQNGLSLSEQNSVKFPPFKKEQKEEVKNPGRPVKQDNKNNLDIDSKLLKLEDYELLKKYLNTKKLSLELIYRGTDHGFKAKEFHSKCDSKGPTLMVAQSEHNQIFGAYVSESWESRGQQDKQDKKAFLFSLTKKFKLIQYQNPDKAIFTQQNYGPSFGGGWDLYIGTVGDFDKDGSCRSYSQFDKATYKLPDEISTSREAQKYLAGAGSFKLQELEVFKVGL